MAVAVSEFLTKVSKNSPSSTGGSQYFIYVMEKEDAVMGTELTAKEVPVTVLDMNEQYVAVDEMISGDVIVSSDKDITDGSRVRLEEE